MNGPTHFHKGERLLAASEDTSLHSEADTANVLAAQAQAHFTAAIAACLATSHHPESVSWEEAING
ncbi:hypothetical protein ACIA6D_23660 [Streptomyces cacaoi]